MKILIRQFLLISFVSALTAYGDEKLLVKSAGETFVSKVFGKHTVDVKVQTHEINIGKPSDGIPNIRDAKCTYSRYPCSVVDRLDIYVNKKPMFVPKSIYMGLSDLTLVNLLHEKNCTILVLEGGDASESYFVKIFFDNERVFKRQLFSALEPSNALEETTYNKQKEIFD
jgi:hypothetical protein